MKIFKSLILLTVFTNSGALAQAPAEDEALTEQYLEKRREAIEDATRRLDEAYLAKMKEIQKRWLQAERFEDARRIEEMLQRFQTLEEFPGTWNWGEKGDRNLRIREDKTARLDGIDYELAWIVLEPGKVRLFMKTSSYLLALDESGTKGTAERADGLKTTIRRAD